MCIGTPMQVIEAGDFEAVCSVEGTTARVDLSLVGPQQPGTWLLVFLGAAREVLQAEEAAKIRAAHRALHDIMNGSAPDLDAHFADLIGRTPELPPHLEPQTRDNT